MVSENKTKQNFFPYRLSLKQEQSHLIESMVPVTVKKVVGIALYGPPFNQLNYEKAIQYQLSYNKQILEFT